jgi:lipopolysaccharide biosynthesis glycosyltransferase
VPDASSGPIVVASCVDRVFLPFVEVVATSIAASANHDRPVDYHVLYDGPESWLTRRLRAFSAGPVRVHLHVIANPWREFGTINGFPPSALLRLSLEDTLPDSVERLIYLDVDLIVECDLGPLFDLPLNGRGLGAAIDRVAAGWLADPGRADYHRYIRETLGLGYRASTYFQSGVLLLDLPVLRRTGYQRKMTETLRRFGSSLLYADQCAANHVLQGDYEVIDSRWNVQPLDMRIVSDPWITHYAGRKPWQQLGVSGGSRWWKHARSLPTFPLFIWRFVAERSRLELKALRRRVARRLHQRR